MRLLIDGDGCPDRISIIHLAHDYHLEVITFIDYAHVLKSNENVIYCEVGRDSVDMAIFNEVQKGDLVITQDYGLAAHVLMKDAIVIHVSGKRIDHHNIDELLAQRYIGYMNRQMDKHIKGPKKRKQTDRQRLLNEIERVIKDVLLF